MPSRIPHEILQYFAREEFFPSLAEWTYELRSLYNRSYMLRTLLMENIDIEESQSLRYDSYSKRVFENFGVGEGQKDKGNPSAVQTGRMEEKEGLSNKMKEALQGNMDGFTDLMMYRLRRGLEKGVDEKEILREVVSEGYISRILSHRQHGFSSQMLVYDGYWFYDWCSQIADLCNSLLPIFKRLAKEELYTHPYLDVDLHETIEACIKMQTLIQNGEQSLETTDLSLEEDDTDLIGKKVEEASVGSPDGGILTPVGSHVLVGDPLIKLENGALVRFDLPPERRQPAWTVTKLFVSPGDTLQADRRIINLSALKTKVTQDTFMDSFYEVCKQLGRIRSKAIYLKEAIEEEAKGGATPGRKRYDYSMGRYAKLEEQPEEETEVEGAGSPEDLGEKAYELARKMRASMMETEEGEEKE